MDTYTQCEIRCGKTFQVAWIPTPYATTGKYIKIGNGNVWEDGWIVSCAYATRDKEDVESHERDYRLMPTAG